MSEDENLATGGQQHQPNSTPEIGANTSMIDKVKSRVSSIFPNKFAKWFSPSTSPSNSTDLSRNGKLRRRREDRIYDDERQDNNSDSSESENSRTDGGANLIMPPSKKLRLSLEKEQISYQQPSKQLFASTPMPSDRGKHLALLRNENFQRNNNISTFIGSPNLNDCGGIDPRYIDESNTNNADILDVIPERSNWDPLNLSTRRTLNIATTSSYVTSSDTDRLSGNRRKASSNIHRESIFYPNVQQNDGEEILDDEEVPDELDDDEEEKVNAEIRKAQTHYSNISNGIRTKPDGGVGGGGGGINFGRPHIAAGRIVACSDSASESGESQCSSMQQRPKSGFNPSPVISSKRTSSMANGLNFYSHLEGKKSLFSEKNMTSLFNNSTMSLNTFNRHQHFNSSLYGSTSALSDSRILSTSPFYKGRTTYGGASAYNKYSSIQQQRHMRITPTLMRPTSSLSSSSNNSLVIDGVTTTSNATGNHSLGISSTAKRILELMNQFATPLSDAKKMGDSMKLPALTGQKQHRFDESDLMSSRAGTPYSRPNQSPAQLRPPINELHIPSMAQLVQMRKLHSRNETVRNIANSSSSILNIREAYTLPSENGGGNSNNNNANNNNKSLEQSKHTNKIRNKITIKRPTTKNLNQNNTEVEEVLNVHLSDIQLPFMERVPVIDIEIASSSSTSVKSNSIFPPTGVATISSEQNSLKLPTFTGGSVKIMSTASETGIPQISSMGAMKPIQSTTSILLNQTSKAINKNIIDDEFRFAYPISFENALPTRSDCEIENFKFSPPVDVVDANSNFTKLSTNQSKTIIESSSSKAMPIQTLKTGSVLQALKNTSSIVKTSSPEIVKSVGFGDTFKMKSNQWECTVCMVHNSQTNTACIACNVPRKPTISPIKPLSPISNSFGDAFKPKSDTWECKECMVRNNNNQLTCLACNSKKPGARASTQVLPASKSLDVSSKYDDGFKAIAKQQSAEKWECSTCMTRNDTKRIKCICCEQSKPGFGPNIMNAPPFSFGGSPKFKFGFDNKTATETKDTESNRTNLLQKTDEGPKTSEFIFAGQNSAKNLEQTKTNNFTFGFSTKTSTAASVAAVTAVTKPITSSGGDLKFDGQPANPSIIPVNEVKTIPPQPVNNKFVIDNNQTPLLSGNNNTTEIVKSVAATITPQPVTLNTSVNDINKSNDVNSGKDASAFKPVGGFTFGTTNSNATGPVVMENKLLTFGGARLGAGVQKKTFGFNSTSDSPASPDSSPKSTKSFGQFGNTTSTIKSSELTKPILGGSFSDAQSNQKRIFSPNKIQNSSSVVNHDSISPMGAPQNILFGKSQAPASPLATPLFGVSPKPGLPGNGAGGFGSIQKVHQPTPALFGSAAQGIGQNLSIAAGESATFGSQNSVSATATFGSQSSVSPTPTFGSQSSVSVTPTFGSQSSVSATPTFGSQSSVPATATHSSGFGNTFASSNMSNSNNGGNSIGNAATNQQSSNNYLFNFGAKTSTTPVFGNASDSNVASPATMPTNASFMFNTPKTNSPPSLFGNPSGTANNNSTNAFGQQPRFGAAATAAPTFGQNPAMNINPFNTVGGNSQVPQQNPRPSTFGTTTPTFGSPAPPTPFGSNSATAGPLFGASSQPQSQPQHQQQQQQQQHGFGGTPSTFGSFGNNNTNEPVTKKLSEPAFNFGSAAQQSSTGGFSFGSNINNNNNNTNSTTSKPAFNFSAQGQTPSTAYNFTGTSEATNSSQPFQFGAPSNTATMQTPFYNNFGGFESTPNAPFQFNAAPAAANNIFAPTPGTTSTAVPRRKIRTATRRMTPR